jgi:Ca2+-binding RTX toxin-like protein
VQVRASDGTGFDTQDLTVNVTNVNEAPTAAKFSFDASILNGTSTIDTAVSGALAANKAIGAFTATDPDASTTLTYSLGAGSSSLFSLSNTGVLSTGGANVPSGIYTLNIVASDGSLSSTTTVKVWIGTSGTDNENLGTDPNVGNGLNIAFGLNGNDNAITGGSGSDAIAGGQGNDALIGGAGNDALVGGTQNDTLTGGGGADVMVGGANNDTFVFAAVTDSGPGAGNYDTITDFKLSGSDMIDLSAIDANTTAGGNQAFAFQGQVGGANTVSANSVSYYQDIAANETIIYANLTSVSNHVDMEIHLSGIKTLVAGDFVL